jgi:hypothetical protein
VYFRVSGVFESTTIRIPEDEVNLNFSIGRLFFGIHDPRRPLWPRRRSGIARIGKRVELQQANTHFVTTHHGSAHASLATFLIGRFSGAAQHILRTTTTANPCQKAPSTHYWCNWCRWLDLSWPNCQSTSLRLDNNWAPGLRGYV